MNSCDWIIEHFRQMNYEFIRLQSFFRQECRYLPIPPSDLARSGFYLISGDRIKCYFCRRSVYNWAQTDKNPISLHSTFKPICPFLANPNRTNNVANYTGMNESQAKLFMESLRSIRGPDIQNLDLSNLPYSPPDHFCCHYFAEKFRELQNKITCKVCFANDVEVVFIPCGHQVTCVDCCTMISNCCVCHKEISYFHNIYFN